MKYLLDTNIVIEMLKARGSIQEAVIKHGTENCYVSEVTISELKAGYYLSRNEKERKDIEFVETRFHIIPVTSEIWDQFAENRALLQRQGKKVPALDLLIMSTAMKHRMTAVSHDRHFTMLEQLKLQDWLTSSPA